MISSAINTMMKLVESGLSRSLMFFFEINGRRVIQYLKGDHLSTNCMVGLINPHTGTYRFLDQPLMMVIKISLNRGCEDVIKEVIKEAIVINTSFIIKTDPLFS